MAPPAWAYEVDNFTPSPDKEFICSICQNVFCDPLMTPCSHVFCKHCITSWLVNNSNCPICRKFTTKFTLKEVIPMLKNLISNLTLRCHNFKRGCNDILTIERCEAHVQSCSFGLIQCSNYPCTEMLNKKSLHEHETESCPHIRFIPCDACKLTIPARVSGKHNCIMVLKKIIEAKDEVGEKNEKIIDDLQKKLHGERMEKSKISLEKTNIECELNQLKRKIGLSSSYDITQSIGALKVNEITSPNKPKQLQAQKIYEETSMIIDSSENFSFKTPEGANGDGEKSDENLVLTEMIKKDITEWELGNQWPLTCYGPFAYRASFSGFNDVSFEELRFETLQAKEKYAYGFFTRKITTTIHDVYQKRNRLKQSSDDSKCFIKNLMKEESLNVCATSVADGRKKTIRTALSYIPPKDTRFSYRYEVKKDAVTGRKYYSKVLKLK